MMGQGTGTTVPLEGRVVLLVESNKNGAVVGGFLEIVEPCVIRSQ